MKKILQITLIILTVALCAKTSNAQLIKDKQTLAHLESQLKIQKNLAENRAKSLFKVLDLKLNIDETQALKYLLAYSPLSDLADYDGQFFLDNAKM